MVLSTAMLCLALNIYHEARSEPLVGQHAVAQVTMNRAKRDPDKLCKVVFEPKQFSWANALTAASPDERARLAAGYFPKDRPAWNLARSIAYHTVKGHIADFTQGAIAFHVRSVRPVWRHHFERVQIVGAGRHFFYRNIA